MLNWIISSTVLILVVITLRFLLKGKISLRLQYALWALVLVRLLFPFSIGETAVSIGNWLDQVSQTKEVNEVYQFAQTELPNMSYQQAYEEVADKYQNQGIDINTIPEEKFAEIVDYEIVETMTGEWSLEEIAKGVWLVGGIVVGVWFVISNFKFQRKLVTNRRLLELDKATIASETNAIIEVCKDKLSIYVCDEIDTPCLLGLLHPSIYVTSEVLKDEAALRHVIAHEKNHYLQADHIWGYFRALCLAIHWYNPLVWSAAFLSRNDAELACDEATIFYLGEQERASYGRTLIYLTCEKRPAVLVTATTMTGSGKAIKERISMIVKKPKMALITLILVVVLAIIAILCTFTGGKQYASFEEWTSTLETEDIQYAKVSKGYGIEQLAYDVPEEEYEQLCEILKMITDENCFRRKQEGSRTGDSLYIKRADRDWVFQCLDDGTIGLLFDTESGAYFGSEGKRLIIESQELWDYIMETLEEKATSREESNTTELPNSTVDEIQVIEYDQLSSVLLITDVEMIQNVWDLIGNEHKLILTIEASCEMDFNEVYEVDGFPYYLVVEADSWDYYEEQARNYYTDTYVAEQFTSFYIDEIGLFVEANGKLYRALADGITCPPIEGTVELWQIEEGLYYATVQTDSDEEGSMAGYIIQVAENKPHGFEIVDKLPVVENNTTYVIEDESEDTTYN